MENSAASRIVASDCVLLFADLQAGIVDLSRTRPLDKLRKSVAGLATLAKIYAMPFVVSGVRGADGAEPPMLAEIEQALGSYPVHYRTTCDSFRNAGIVEAIRATGRKTLLIAGVATELAVQLPALTATAQGYRVFVVLDACGGVDERSEDAALRRIAQAGASTVSVFTLAGELIEDLQQPPAEQAVGVLYGMAQV